MKYKNIKSAIHNFGHSFISFMNYVDDVFIIDELQKIHRQNQEISVDWLSLSFEPQNDESKTIKQSIKFWADSLSDHLESQGVELNKLKSLQFIWPVQDKSYMVAVDDRDKEHKIYINQT